MIIIELMGPPVSHKRNPDSILISTYLVWQAEVTPELKLQKLVEVKESIASGKPIDVDYIIVVEQDVVRGPQGIVVKEPVINSIAPGLVNHGPFSINLKDLEYYAICHGKISKELTGQIVTQCARDQARRDAVDRLVEPVHTSLKEALSG